MRNSNLRIDKEITHRFHMAITKLIIFKLFPRVCRENLNSSPLGEKVLNSKNNVKTILN